MGYIDFTRVPVLRNGIYQIMDIGEVKTDDFLFGQDASGRGGRPVRVLLSERKSPVDACYRLSFDNDRHIIMDDDTVTDVMESQHEHEQMTAADLFCKFTQSKSFYVRPGAGCYFDIRHDFPVNPYVIGAATANATLTQGPFILHTSDDDVAAKVSKLINAAGYDKSDDKNRKNTCHYTFRSDGTRTKSGYHRIQTKDLFCDFPDFIGTKASLKHVPESYLYGNSDERWILLQGLFDGDGCISVSAANKVILTYSTVSEQLWHQVSQILYSLGIEHTMYEHDERAVNKFCDGREFKPNFATKIINVRCPHGLKANFFTSERKCDIADKAVALDTGNNKRYRRTRILDCQRYVPDEGRYFVDLKLADGAGSFTSADNILLYA